MVCLASVSNATVMKIFVDGGKVFTFVLTGLSKVFISRSG